MDSGRPAARPAARGGGPRASGPLQSPFTQEYLDDLLTRHGFEQIQRYHAVNGLFRREDGKRTLEEAAQMPARFSNNLTARKGGTLAATSADYGKRHARRDRWPSTAGSPGKDVRVVVSLKNVGETSWLAGGEAPGCVPVALRSGNPGEPELLEAEPRQPLPEVVPPGKTATLTLEYILPAGGRDRQWEIDLVSERLFWFSTRGTRAGIVPRP